MSMPMVYIATGFDNGKAAAELSDLLEAMGVGTTYRWWEHPIAEDLDPRSRARNAKADMDGVKAAHLLIVLVHGEPAAYRSRGLGTNVELGAALSNGIPALLCSPTLRPGPFCIFHYHPGVVGWLAARCPETIASLAFAAASASECGSRIPDLPFEWADPDVLPPGMEPGIPIIEHDPQNPCEEIAT